MVKYVTKYLIPPLFIKDSSRKKCKFTEYMRDKKEAGLRFGFNAGVMRELKDLCR